MHKRDTPVPGNSKDLQVTFWEPETKASQISYYTAWSFFQTNTGLALTSWLDIIPQSKRLLAWFLVRAHAWVVHSVPCWGSWLLFLSHINVSLPLFFSLSLKLSKYNLFLKKNSVSTLASVAQLVWISSCNPEGHRFGSWSGHMPGLQVQLPIEVCLGGNQSMFLSHIDVSLPLPPCPSL